MNESTAHTLGQPTAHRYLAPGWFTRNVFNRFVAWLTRRGVSVAGSRELRVVGRSSGAVRSTAVNLLTVDGRRYLVAPRGTTQWVRNLRVAGQGELRVGRRLEAFQGRELADAEKPPVLRAYVERWRWEVGQFFEGLSKEPTNAELASIASGFPVFEVRQG
ncbi:MAG TPA: nitroreductase/quinone reductase family protein [Acidimicrobiales bacterium]|nr:nitroreductase/quinone reductase family protein [Acidimicrobiales bacterium]